MIPQSFIQDLLARVDIVEVIERYLPLKKGGANYFACCPFHGEKSASFSVSPTKQFYHCFGCGVHGSAISFLMEYSGLGFVDAVKELASGVGMEVPQDDFTPKHDRSREQSLTEQMAQAARFYKEQLKRSPVANRLPERPRPDRRDRRPLRPRLRPGRLAVLASRLLPTTASPACWNAAWSSKTNRGDATIASATASSSQSRISAAT